MQMVDRSDAICKNCFDRAETILSSFVPSFVTSEGVATTRLLGPRREVGLSAVWSAVDEEALVMKARNRSTVDIDRRCNILENLVW